MRIRNLNFSEFSDDVKYIVLRIVVIGILGSYYLIDHQTQIPVEPTDYLEEFADEEGEIVHEFLPGEHKIERRRVDSFSHTITEVEGYKIESVKTIALIDQSKTVYVNTEPVIAIGKMDKDGNVRFNEFGKVIVKRKKKSL